MSTRELPTGIVTFWFTDIERSTILLQDLGHEVFASILEDHNRILTQIVGPSLISTEGDSFFCVFGSPVDAVRAAASAQRELENHSWPDRGRVRIRIGMHTGPARFGGSDFVGLDVHRAARISSAGHGGQVLMSDATRALVEHSLPEATSLVDLGEHRLKDLLQPEHLFQLNIEGLQESFPPVISMESGQVRAPEPLTEFVGRQAELGEIEAALAASRLVTLVGMGGVGKTRLALQAARTLDLGRGNSVFFVELTESTDDVSVAKSAAESLSLSEQAGRPIENTMTDYLRGKADLLIFDNCEHVVSRVAPLIETLLGECPDLRVMTTSREPLLIDGEQAVNIAPMAVLPGGEAGAGDAVDLFVLRAREASSAFDPSGWSEQIAAICLRLEGIPLAIELAAARIPMLTPREILELLDQRFALLTTRRRKADPRHQTMEATLDWSYDLLDPDSQELLAVLSVFRGGFTMEAVRSVCFDEGLDLSLVLDRMASLYERSLLGRSTSSGRTRFHLLDTVRDYAHRKLVENHDDQAITARHSAFFVEFAKQQTALLGGSSQQLEALELLEVDHDNIREVLDRAKSTGNQGLAADLAGRLAWFWYVHGHFSEGEARAERLLEGLPDEIDRSWLRLLIGSAQFDYRLGRFDRAATKLSRAIEGAQTSGDRRLEMWAHAYSATNELFRVNFRESQDEAEKALVLAEQEGDLLAFSYLKVIQTGGTGFRLEIEGTLTPEKASELKAELDPFAEAARTLGERNVVGHVMEAQGLLSFRADDVDGARTAFDQSIVALTELGTVGCSCHCLEAIALCAAESGLLDPAVRLIGASDGLRGKVGIEVAPMEEPFRAGALEIVARAESVGSIEAIRASSAGSSMSEALQTARDTLLLL